MLNIETKQIYRKATECTILHPSPVVSVIMPFYNVPTSYIQESINSVLSQTFTDFELIIIDDGSTDSSAFDLINTYKDKRIRLISNHHDFIDSLNRGVKESKGKYLARMDADDIMTPNRLQIQYEYMEGHPEIDVCGSFIEILGTGRIMEAPVNHKEIIASMLLSNSIAHPTIIMRKESVLKKREDLYTKGYIAAEDYKLWTDLALDDCFFANIPEVLLKYRISENQVTRNYQEEGSLSASRIKMEYAEKIMEKIIDSNDKFIELFNPLMSPLRQPLSPINFLIFSLYI